MPKYEPAEELAKVGNRIIEKFHPHLKVLKIKYLFREEAAITEGRVIAGMAHRVDDRNWSIHKVDALIEIAKDVWNEASDKFKEALMDHELSHVGVRTDEHGNSMRDEQTSRIKLVMRKHDIEEFQDVLERHGDYHKALRDFLDAFAKRKEDQKKEKAEEKDE